MLSFLYDIINKYCLIEDLKLEEFEEYCNKWDYFTVAARILSRMMTTAHNDWKSVTGSRDELYRAFCNAFYDEDFWEGKDSPPNIIQESKDLSLEKWWMKHASDIQFGHENNHDYFDNLRKQANQNESDQQLPQRS